MMMEETETVVWAQPHKPTHRQCSTEAPPCLLSKPHNQIDRRTQNSPTMHHGWGEKIIRAKYRLSFHSPFLFQTSHSQQFTQKITPTCLSTPQDPHRSTPSPTLRPCPRASTSTLPSCPQRPFTATASSQSRLAAALSPSSSALSSSTTTRLTL